MIGIERIECRVPIQASWFRDRYFEDEWDSTIEAFSKIGGEILVQRGPQLLLRSKQDITDDYNTFVWCGTAPGGVGGPTCLDAVEQRAAKRGLTVGAWMSYTYQDDYTPAAMIRCPELDGRTNSSRIYYQLVVPLSTTKYTNESDPCSFAPGSEVGVIMTAFAGTDPHALLLERAALHGKSVYAGLPMMWAPWNDTIVPSYVDLVSRILDDHAIRFAQPPLSTALAGYYATDEMNLGSPDPHLLSLYQSIGALIQSHQKRFLLSPYIDVNYSQLNSTIEAHVAGLNDILQLHVADILAIQEGRGTAKGDYYWQHQIDSPIAQVDPGLLAICQYLDPTVPNNQTYRLQYAASNRQLFQAFAQEVDDYNARSEKPSVALWLNVEAFEYLRNYPCLPVDQMGSGMAELLDRTSKQRIDRSFTVQSAFVSGIISFAWDADYTCVPRGSGYNMSLAAEIIQDGWRPIATLLYPISNSSSSSSSIGVVGLNLKEVATYYINYQSRDGTFHNITADPLSLDQSWGRNHGRLVDLEMVQIPFLFWNDLDPINPLLSVQPQNAYWPCFFI